MSRAKGKILQLKFHLEKHKFLTQNTVMSSGQRLAPKFYPFQLLILHLFMNYSNFLQHYKIFSVKEKISNYTVQEQSMKKLKNF